MKTCIVCKSTSFNRKIYDRHNINLIFYLWKQLWRGRNQKTEPFKGYISVCAKCGYGSMDKPPTLKQLEDYYVTEYWSLRSKMAQEVTAESGAFRKNLRAKYQIDFLFTHLKKDAINNVLEIGAGSAYASLLLREKCGNTKIKLYVCEPGENWKEYYKKNDIEHISDYFPFETSKRFDYIHTSHWLEHVLDLNSTLHRLNQILKPGGSVFIEVPNTEFHYWSLPIRDTPHIHFFTRSSLVEIFTAWL